MAALAGALWLSGGALLAQEADSPEEEEIVFWGEPSGAAEGADAELEEAELEEAELEDAEVAPTAEGEGGEAGEGETLVFGAPAPPAAGPAAAPLPPFLVKASFDQSMALDTRLDPADVHTLEAHSRAALEISGPLSAGSRVQLGARLIHRQLFGPDAGHHTQTEVEVREAWIEQRLGPVDLRLGQLIFAYGANEGGPADVLNPPDLRGGLGGGLLGGAEGKIPVPALRARLWLGEAKLEGALLPFFVPARAWLTGYDWGLAAGAGLLGGGAAPDLASLGYDATGTDQLQPFLLHTRLPEATFENLQAALRLSGRLGPLDLALTYVDGFDTLPRQHLDPDLAALLAAKAQGEPLPFGASLAVAEKLEAGALLYEAWYARRRVFAAELSAALGDWSLRGDLGYSPGRTLYALYDDPDQGPTVTWVEAQVLSGVLGVEYLDPEGLSVGATLQVFGVPGGRSDMRLVGLEDAGPDSLPATPGRWAGLEALVAFARWRDPEGRLELMGAGLLELSGGSWALLPAATYHFDDHLSLYVRAELLGGPPGELLGGFAHNSQVLMGLSYRR